MRWTRVKRDGPADQASQRSRPRFRPAAPGAKAEHRPAAQDQAEGRTVERQRPEEALGRPRQSPGPSEADESWLRMVRDRLRETSLVSAEMPRTAKDRSRNEREVGSTALHKARSPKALVLVRQVQDNSLPTICMRAPCLVYVFALAGLSSAPRNAKQSRSQSLELHRSEIGSYLVETLATRMCGRRPRVAPVEACRSLSWALQRCC